jgi:hypothetical protein
MDKIGSALFGGQRWVLVRKGLRVLGPYPAGNQEGKYGNDNSQIDWSHVSPSNYPPAEPEALRLLAPQRGLFATG